MTTEGDRHGNRRGVASRKLVRDELSGVSFVISSGRRNLSVGVERLAKCGRNGEISPKGRNDNRGGST